jgi:CBS domain-containing protein
MKVKDRMTVDVKTVGPDTSITEAFRIMKENNIRRLPVIKDQELIGIVTLSDLNQASPSAATSLSIHELNYILAKTKIKDILPRNQQVITIKSNNYIETAAKIMRQHRISGLPVIDEGQLVGIVTETDIFDALIDILRGNPQSMEGEMREAFALWLEKEGGSSRLRLSILLLGSLLLELAYFVLAFSLLHNPVMTILTLILAGEELLHLGVVINAVSKYWAG